MLSVRHQPNIHPLGSRLFTISVVVLVAVLCTASATDARVKRGLAGVTAGYRFESDRLNDGFTIGILADNKLYKSLTVTGIIDVHWSGASGRYNYPKSGVGGWVGIKVRKHLSRPGTKWSLGIALGLIKVPGRLDGEYTSLRFSMEMAHVAEKVGGFVMELSVIHLLSRIGEEDSLRKEPIISLRCGLIFRAP